MDVIKGVTMKQLLKLLILIILIHHNHLFSQVDTILNDLNSKNLRTKMMALYRIQDERLAEYLPVLEEKLFNQPEPFLSLIIFKTLDLLEDPNIISLAYEFIDYSNNFRNMFPPRDTLYAKIIATKILLKRGDSQTVNYIFQMIDRDFPDLDPEVIDCLSILIRDFETLESQAKNELIRYARSGKSNSLRSYSINVLFEKYSYDLIPFIKERFESDTYLPILVNSFGRIIQAQLEDNEDYFIRKLDSNLDPIVKTFIADSLLSIYGKPMDLKAVMEYYINETDTLAAKTTELIIRSFKAKEPDYHSTILELLTNLTRLVDSISHYNWLSDLTFSNELKSILNTAKTNLQNGDSLACRVNVKEFQDLVDNVYKDSLNTDPRFVTIEGWKFLYWNAQYILDRLPEPQTNPNLLVKLKNSLGNQIPASNVMYYEGSWKDAVNNGDGTFTVITSKPTVSIRMFYEYANQTVNNVPAQNNTYTFTTVNAAVQLKNSSGNLIDEGTVQYYAGAWRSFGTTINGVAYKELLPVNYSFRMTYEYVLNDKQQNLSENPVVDFNTVLCTIKVTNANNQPLEGANTKYYSIAWRDIGLTNSSGEITKELLPKNLSFRATYNNVSRDKQQDISVNNLVEIMLNVP